MSTIEWSHPVEVESLKKGRITTFDLACEDEDILSEIAERVGVSALRFLRAHYEIEAKDDGCRYHVRGGIQAGMVQECVTSLDPMDTAIDARDLESWFVRDDSIVSFNARKSKRDQGRGDVMEAEPGEMQMLDEEDAPEQVIEGKIDLGELSVQFLVLNINPFPRKDDDGTAFEYKEFSKDSPFASLANLKNK